MKRVNALRRYRLGSRGAAKKREEQLRPQPIATQRMEMICVKRSGIVPPMYPTSRLEGTTTRPMILSKIPTSV